LVVSLRETIWRRRRAESYRPPRQQAPELGAARGTRQRAIHLPRREVCGQTLPVKNGPALGDHGGSAMNAADLPPLSVG